MKNNILHLITSPSKGGLEVYVAQYIRKLQEKGIKQAAVILAGSYVQQEISKDGIPVFTIKAGSRYNPLRILQLRKIISDGRYNVIHAHTNNDMWMGVLSTISFRNIQVVFSLYIGIARKLDFIHRYIYSRISCIVSTSESMNSLVTENYPVARQKIKLVRYGRDLSLYTPSHPGRNEIRRQLKIQPEIILAGMMARIDEMKGTLEAVQAWHLLAAKERNKIKLLIIGDRTISSQTKEGRPIYNDKSDRYYNNICSLIETNESGISIIMLPFQAQYIPYLFAMDIFLLPSYDEMYSLSVIDAMLTGLPVIGTNCGGTVEQIRHGKTGMLIAPRQAEPIAEMLKYYSDNPKKIRQHGKAARQWAIEQHDWNKVLPKYLHLYEQVSEY